MISIHPPTHEHIDQILHLNSKYLITHLDDSQKQNGFIRIEYNRNDLQKIIDAKEIVIASKNNLVIGYYLIGKKCDKSDLDYQRNKAYTLSDSHNTPFEKIGYGCQVCIEENYRKNGLFKRMLVALAKTLENNYNDLLCSVSDDNIVSMKTHRNNGWEIIDSLGTRNYLIYNIHKAI